jgi:hypothetical protein
MMIVLWSFQAVVILSITIFWSTGVAVDVLEKKADD